MFARSNLLRSCVVLVAAATAVLSNTIPTPNGHHAAIQVDEHDLALLESRAPKPYKTHEEELIYTLCKGIEKEFYKNDFWFFVGNSGGYLAYCFEHERFKPIPMSGTRKYQVYKHREDDPENKGVPVNGLRDLIKYYDEIIAPKIKDIQIDRIMLVDHSSSGKSVEATKMILETMFENKSDAVEQRFRKVKWGLFNVIDESKFDSKGRISGVTNPEGFDYIRLITAGDDGEVNKLVGDKRKHPRCQADYWPSRWYLGVDEVWRRFGDKPAATQIRNQIRQAVKDRNKGQLLNPRPNN